MMYVVIIREMNGIYSTVCLDLKMNAVIKRSNVSIDMLEFMVRGGAIPLNFKIEGGRVTSACGSFKRFEHGGVSLVVLKSLVSRSGRVIGFRCLNTKTLKIGNTRVEELVNLQSRQGSYPVLQNGIIRNGTVNSYPNCPFIKEVVGIRNPSTQKGVRNVDSNKAEAVSKKKLPSFIADERLSNTQRRILLEAKKSGMYVEAFNNPDISPEAMSYYKDVIVSKEIADDCREIIANTKLSVPQIDELYQCAVLGIDYSDYNDENIPSWAMSVFRQEKTMEMWGDISHEEKVTAELRDKCIRLADTLK